MLGRLPAHESRLNGLAHRPERRRGKRGTV